MSPRAVAAALAIGCCLAPSACAQQMMHPTDPFDTDACPWDAVQARAAEVDAACCSDPDSDCPESGGFPTLCSAECAVVFVPFDDQCRDLMAQLMPDIQPSLNSLADRCLTATGEDLFQMVRELEEANCCVDTAAIVSSGEVMGDVEYEREWELVFRQDVQAGGFFQNRAAALNSNPQNPEAALFSQLDAIEDWRDKDGLFTFKMVWPELSPVNSNTWAQETNPFAEGAEETTIVEGYVPLRLHFSGDYNGNQLWQGLLPAPSEDAVAEADFGGGAWGQLGAMHQDQGGCIPGPVCNPASDRHCETVEGSCQGPISGQNAYFTEYSFGFRVHTTELWVSVPPPPPVFFQISYAAEGTEAGRWCASIDPGNIGSDSSDLTLTACDSDDPRQGFSYDEGTRMLRVQSDDDLCLTFLQASIEGSTPCTTSSLGTCRFPFLYNGISYSSCTSDAYSSNGYWCSFDDDYVGNWGPCDCSACEPYTLSACDQADDTQKFELQQLRDPDPGVFQWRSVQPSLNDEVGEVSMDLAGGQVNAGTVIRACTAQQDDVTDPALANKFFQLRSMNSEDEDQYLGTLASFFHSPDLMSKPEAEAYCIEHAGRLAVLSAPGKERAAAELLGDVDGWIAAFCPAEDETCGAQTSYVGEGYCHGSGDVEAGDGSLEACREQCEASPICSYYSARNNDADIVDCMLYTASECPGANGGALLTIDGRAYVTYASSSCISQAGTGCSDDAGDRLISTYGLIPDAPAAGSIFVGGHGACSFAQCKQECDSMFGTGGVCGADCTGMCNCGCPGDGGWSTATNLEGCYDFCIAAFAGDAYTDNCASAVTMMEMPCTTVVGQTLIDLGASLGDLWVERGAETLLSDLCPVACNACVNGCFGPQRWFHPDASDQWFWYDEIGGQQSSLETYSNWQPASGALGTAGETEFCAFHSSSERGGWDTAACNSPSKAALCEWPQDRTPASNVASISIISATYGANWPDLVTEGNENGHLSEECNGEVSCTYHIDARVIGDPAYGFSKNYEVSYDCGCGVVQTASVAAEAHGQDITLDCSGVCQSHGEGHRGRRAQQGRATGKSGSSENSRELITQSLRRLQMFNWGDLEQDTCPFDTFNERSQDLNDVCGCGGDGGSDCSAAGLPSVCSFDCAEEFNALFDDCHDLLVTTVGEEGMIGYNAFAEECFNIDARSLIYAINNAECSAAENGGAMDEEGWVLMVRQDAAAGGFFLNYDAVMSTNANYALEEALTAELYSNLDTIEDYRGSNGAFTLKLQWPGLSPIDHNIWSQTSNPATEATANFEPIEMQFGSFNEHVGLGPSSDGGSAAMDADEGACWFLAVGSYGPYSGANAIPGPVCDASDPLCQQVTGYTSMHTTNMDTCGWLIEANDFIVPAVELWVRSCSGD